ncbi:protein kinase C zeta type-like [Gordionus sp. m RMFG-2023]|uniref:protein kinase C zeta type-like n=1 Tax=Gordionus sp. m RMFG-2023 TaxID=3053472 RepID=UPI0031FDC2FE
MRGSVLDIVDKSKDDCVNVPLDSSQDDDKKRKKKKLSDYEIIKVLGRGSFGEVVLAEQKHTKNLYALKMMDLNLCKTLFENERMILKIARNQPFLVGYHATFTTSENMIIAMDFVNGGDLRSLIKKLDKIPENHVRFYVAELLLGIVHRDLKPGNIKIDQEGHIRIADFGLGKSRFIGDLLLLTGIEVDKLLCHTCLSCGKKIKGRCGTRAYLATEILRGGSYDFREDIWALGVTMFEMLTGERPFDMKLRRNPWQGIVDRDLKPENVKLEVVIWRITDFGLSKKGLSCGKKIKGKCGNMSYLAPKILVDGW